VVALALGSSIALAQETPDGARDAELRLAYQEAVESARKEETAARQALERTRVELEQAAAQAERAGTEEERAQLHEQQESELRAMREELSRVHEDLRRASREVAALHRKMGRTHDEYVFAEAPRPPGVGNKAVIGVVLGDARDGGVPVLGVSPDGPSERAGIKPGDVIVAMMGKELSEKPGDDARAVLSEAMGGVKVGDELSITVERDGERIEHQVTAEKREPFAWQSFVRLPSAPEAPSVPGAPGVPEAPSAVFEYIEIPEIDREALQAQVERLRKDVDRARVVIETRHATAPEDDHEGWSYEFETFSDFGDEALKEANVWFGLPVTRGLKLAEMDADLASYFKADGGVLVLKAREDNDLQLRSGDVILRIGDKSVAKPADVMRALREWEPGASIEIRIKRDRRDQKLDVVMPERQVGYEFAPFSDELHFSTHATED